MTVLLCSQILGFIAKGSYGPILKVRDVFKDKMFAVKVSSAITVIATLYKNIESFSCNHFHRFAGFSKVRDFEAWSGGAVERRSYHSGITPSNLIKVTILLLYLLLFIVYDSKLWGV